MKNNVKERIMASALAMLMVLAMTAGLVMGPGAQTQKARAAAKNYKVLFWTIKKSNDGNAKGKGYTVQNLIKAYSDYVPEYLNGGTITVDDQSANTAHFSADADLASKYDMIVLFLSPTAYTDSDVDALKAYLDDGGRIYIICEVTSWIKENENTYASGLVARLGGNFSIDDGSKATGNIPNTMIAKMNNSSTIIGGKPLAGTTGGNIQLHYYANISIPSEYMDAVEIIATNGAKGLTDGDIGKYPVIVDQAIGKGRVTVTSDFNWMIGEEGHSKVNEANRGFTSSAAYAEPAYDLMARMILNSANNMAIVAAGGNPNAGFGSNHGFEYYFDDKTQTLTATCVDENCELHTNPLTLNFTAEDDSINNRHGYVYDKASETKNNFISFTKAEVGEIKYSPKGDAAHKSTVAPTKAGEYTAYLDVKIGDKTYSFSDDFVIAADGIAPVIDSGESYTPTPQDEADASQLYRVETELNPDDSVTVLGYWDETDPEKELIFTIGNTEYALDMSDVVNGTNKNFSFVIPAEEIEGIDEISIYHEDHKSKAKTLKIEHEHEWEFFITENEDLTQATVTAYCTQTKQEDYCDYLGEDNAVEFTITAPETRVYQAGVPSKAVLGGIEEFNEAIGLVVSDESVVYYCADGDTTNTGEEFGGAQMEGAAPTMPGTYCAAITISGEKAYVWFKIAEDADDAEEDPEIPDQNPWELNEDVATEIAYSDGYLHITDEGESIRLYAYDYDLKTKTKGAMHSETYLDFRTEKLFANITYDCYSLDGGRTWKKTETALTSTDIGKWFSKAHTILIAAGYDPQKKKPGESATVYYLGKTKGRAATTQLKVEYASCRDPYGFTNGQWSLLNNKKKKIDLSNYEFMPTDDIGAKLCADTGLGKANIAEAALTGLTQAKTFTDRGYWATWPGLGGIWVPDISSEGKTVKAKIVYRIKASVALDSSGEPVVTPAGKTKKITVSSIQKAPKIKVDYKKQTLKVKAGTSVFFGTAIPKNAAGNPMVKTIAVVSSGAMLDYEDYAGKAIINFSKTAAKNFSIAPYITSERNTILLWQHATDKKPASAVQTIKLAARGLIEEGSVTVDNKGRVTLDNKYEILKQNNKWSAAKNLTASEDTYYPVRVKCTAKGGKETDTYTESAIGVTGTLILKTDGTKIISASLSRKTIEELTAGE